MMGDTFRRKKLVKVERWRFSVENTTYDLDNGPVKYNGRRLEASKSFKLYQKTTFK